MAKTESIHMRIDPELKSNAEQLLNQLGLTTSDAINIFLKQVVLKGGLPFEVKIPQYNEITLAAMEEAKQISRTGKSYGNFKDVLKELDS